MCGGWCALDPVMERTEPQDLAVLQRDHHDEPGQGLGPVLQHPRGAGAAPEVVAALIPAPKSRPVIPSTTTPHRSCTRTRGCPRPLPGPAHPGAVARCSARKAEPTLNQGELYRAKNSQSVASSSTSSLKKVTGSTRTSSKTSRSARAKAEFSA
jgi:hypothetical protein